MASVLRLLPVLPKARRWVRRLVAEHRSDSESVASRDMQSLTSCFDADFLARSRVVFVDQTPELPLAEWGLDGLAVMSPRQTRGITFDDTYFLVRECADDASLYFHELVHVVQWERLGISRFLTIYGVGLVEHGYRDSPLERMAYDMQERFDAGEQFDALTEARESTDALVKQFRSEQFDHGVALWLARVL